MNHLFTHVYTYGTFITLYCNDADRRENVGGGILVDTSAANGSATVLTLRCYNLGQFEEYAAAYPRQRYQIVKALPDSFNPLPVHRIWNGSTVCIYVGNALQIPLFCEVLSTRVIHK